MSNFISIISRAYSRNFIDEAADAASSAVRATRAWREPANEADIAKVTGFALKIIGTIPLVLLGMSALHVLQKRTASLSRIYFAIGWYFSAADVLKASNNLRFEYSMTAAEKGAQRKTEKQGEWFSGARAMFSHALSKAKQSVRAPIEAYVIDDPNDIEEFRAIRVLQVAVKDTYMLAPLFRLCTQS